MTFLLLLVSYVGLASFVVFFAYSMCCGLFYISEWVEDHASIGLKFINYSLISVSMLVVLFLLLGEISSVLCVGILASHACFKVALADFPRIEMSPSIVIGFVLVIANHVVSTAMDNQFLLSHPYPFIGFCAVCLWAVPVGVVVSLTAGDSYIPSSTPGLGDPQSKRRSLVVRVAKFFAD